MEQAMTQQSLLDTGYVRSTVLQRHPVGAFFALTLGVAWALWVPLVLLRDQMPMGLGVLLIPLGSLAPSTMAILLVARQQGRAEVRRLLRRLLVWRVGIGWDVAIAALTTPPG